jgi:hypothetical protein
MITTGASPPLVPHDRIGPESSPNQKGGYQLTAQNKTWVNPGFEEEQGKESE